MAPGQPMLAHPPSPPPVVALPASTGHAWPQATWPKTKQSITNSTIPNFIKTIHLVLDHRWAPDANRDQFAISVAHSKALPYNNL